MSFTEQRGQAIKAALESQGFMQLVGAEVEEVSAGSCVIALRARPELMQHNGLFHGGVIAFLVDNTTTAAAATMVSDADLVLTAEYKLNLLAPGIGERLVCRAQVVKSGRMLTVVEAKVYAATGGKEKLIAVALATIANLPQRTAAQGASSSDPAP
jgi:uncharacterized protein (TIGR00369 family)